MLGVEHIKHSRQGRGRKTTYDRYEVGLKAVEVQGVPGCESVVRGSGRARHRDRGEAPQDGSRCPQCGRRGKIVRTMEPRRWRDVRLCGRNVFLHYCLREIRCPTHGRRVEDPPWAEPGARITYRLEYLLLKYCQVMPQSAAGQMLGLASSTLSGILHRVIDRIRQPHKIRGLKTMGIDEVSYAKGRKFATVVYDLDRSCVVWVGRGKARE